MKYSYNWLQSYFDKPLPTPEEIEEKISLHSFEPEGIEKVGDDTMLDFDVLPNRAHDALCHRGLAKEISLLFNLPLKTDRYQVSETEIKESNINLCVDIKDKNLCRRYMARAIENIEVKESPQWLKNQMATIGQRSINNIVDATNYVMFDLGQPLHAFDFKKLSSKKELIVRPAKTGEVITLLNGEEITLGKDNLVIADHDGPLALAGIKGGKKAEVDSHTANIVIEAANFEPVSTRKASRTLRIQTDSSKRFENEISPELAAEAMEKVTNLIIKLAGTADTKVSNPADIYPNPTKAWTIQLSLSKTNQLLGTFLGPNEVESILKNLDCQYKLNENVWIVWPPLYRLDLLIQEDLIEEIGRLYGFANIPTILPNTLKPAINKDFYYIALIRNFLIKQGFHEVYNYTFTDRGEVEMANALASDKKFLRTNLHEGLAKSLEKNIKNAELFETESIKQFEIGSVFVDDKENLHLALAFGSQIRKTNFDLSQIVKNLSDKLGSTLTVDDHQGILEINLTPILEKLGQPESYKEIPLEYTSEEKIFNPISAYPFVLRDISVWLPAKTNPLELPIIIEEQTKELIAVKPRLVDQYEKEGRISYTYRIILQSQKKTLTDEEANQVMERVTASFPKDWEAR